MFFIAAVIILVVSFVVALLSLLREQKKINGLNREQEASTHKLAVSDANPEKPVESISGDVAVSEPGPDMVPDVNKSVSVDSSVRVDEETVPFPWEVKSQTKIDSIPSVVAVDRASGSVTPPDMTVGDPVISASQASSKLYPKNTATGPTAGLSGSISLKDLKN